MKFRTPLQPDENFVTLLVRSGDKILVERVRLMEHEKAWFERLADLLINKETMLVA